MDTIHRDEIVRRKAAAITSALTLIDGAADMAAPALVDSLRAIPATVLRYANGAYEVRIGGIKTSSTSGYATALRVWAHKARALDGVGM